MEKRQAQSSGGADERSPSPGSGKSSRRSGRRFSARDALLLLLSSAGLSVLCLLLGLGMMDREIFLDYFRRPLLFLLNTLPILGIQVLLLCLLNRQWAAFLLTALLFFTASVGDFYKLRFRSEPFVFSDWNAVGAGLRIAGSYDLTPNLRILLGTALVLGGTLVLLFFARGRLPKRSRAALGALVLLAVFPLWRWVYSSDELYESPALSSAHTIPGWVQQEQVSKGFVYEFLHSIASARQGPPADYDREAALRLIDSRPDAAIPQERRVNVLIFQMEAFSDLRKLGAEGVSPAVYASFDRLAAEGISGEMIANVFAGSTLNTERCFLTGSLRLREYGGPAPSTVWYLDSQGYVTVGSHPNAQSFYNRVNVNRYLGFQDYWFSENHYEQALSALDDPWNCDRVLFPEATEQLLSLAHEGNSVFSFNVTLQGHGPYRDDALLFGEGWWTGEGLSPPSACILNNYLGSVADSLDRLEQCAERLRDDEAPVVLLVYGDHKPWLGDDNSVYQELGIHLDLSDEEGFRNYYSTPYLIWANEAAKELLGSGFSGTGPTVSANFLMTLLFDTLGWEGSSLIQSTRPVMAEIPAAGSNGLYLTREGFTDSLLPEEQRLLRELDGIEYALGEDFSPPDLSGAP